MGVFSWRYMPSASLPPPKNYFTLEDKCITLSVVLVIGEFNYVRYEMSILRRRFLFFTVLDHRFPAWLERYFGGEWFSGKKIYIDRYYLLGEKSGFSGKNGFSHSVRLRVMGWTNDILPEREYYENKAVVVKEAGILGYGDNKWAECTHTGDYAVCVCAGILGWLGPQVYISREDMEDHAVLCK